MRRFTVDLSVEDQDTLSDWVLELGRTRAVLVRAMIRYFRQSPARLRDLSAMARAVEEETRR